MRVVREVSFALCAGLCVASCARGENDSDNTFSFGADEGGIEVIDSSTATRRFGPTPRGHDAGVAAYDAGIDTQDASWVGTIGQSTGSWDASVGSVGSFDSGPLTAETADGSSLPVGTTPVSHMPPPSHDASASTGPAARGQNDGSASTGPAPSGQTPSIGGCPIFPADNAWNTRIDDTTAYPVNPNSATYIANMSPTTHLHADWGDWSSDKYGIPWQTVPASQAMVPMSFDDSGESDPGPYPFPSNAMVEGGSNSGGDMHVLVVDTGTCTLYETYDSTYQGPGWSCGSGAKFNLSSDTLRPDGWTSADAAGLPILPGLVRVSEVQAGAIRHALRFTVSNTQQAYVHPATHAAGKSDASLPPMGLRLRLKASVDISKFTGAAAVILTAMKQYGLILADNGSNWFISGDSDDGWDPLMDGVTQAFSQITGNDFEAVQTGELSTDGL